MDWDEYLREAYRCTDFTQMQYALEQGADPNVSVGGLQHTLLYWAANGGWLDLVRLLLRFGAQVAREADNDCTSLHVAVEHNESDIVALLLAADGNHALNRFDYLSRTPLMLAVLENNLETAQMLIAAGADVNANQEARIGPTALKIAAERGDVAIVRLLLRAGANPLIPGWMGATPWHEAQKRHSPEGLKVRELIEKALPSRTGQDAGPRKRKG